jgi:hypothetical protein
MRSIDPRTHNALEPELQTTEDFSFHIWRQIFRTIVRNEQKAMQTGETVSFAFEVRRQDTDDGNSAPVVKVEVVCEPGKQPRLACDWRNDGG